MISRCESLCSAFTEPFLGRFEEQCVGFAEQGGNAFGEGTALERSAHRGFIDFRVGRDTLIIDRDRGKALIDLSVVEGSRYQVGDFESNQRLVGGAVAE